MPQPDFGRPELIVAAGARPNFMKVAPVLAALRQKGNPFVPRLVHTGQHYDQQMSDVFFDELQIPPPDHHLGVGGGSHGVQTARILERFEEYLLGRDRRPAAVLVVGDVNSTMACALAAAKLHIPVAHLEAGLRSFDRCMPEEINRIVTDGISDLLLVSEPSGETNLLREGVAKSRIRFVGNVMIDSLVHQLPAARALAYGSRLELQPGAYAVVTLHRPSNVDEPSQLAALVQFLDRIAGILPVAFPLHPRTRERLEQFGLFQTLSSNPRIRLTSPLSYREFLSLFSCARLVLTDSGGIQEETTFLGIPCLTLRSNTERPITVSAGTNTLIGADLGAAAAVVSDILAGRYKTGTAIAGWDGHAAERVVGALLEAWAE